MLYSSELDFIISRDILTSNKYLGCYASDQIPIFQDKTFIILNTDPADKIGKHWVVLFKEKNNCYEFFDPLGNSPKNYKFKNFPNFAKLKYSSKILQNPFKNACGYYCLYYVFFKTRGYNLEDIFEKCSVFYSDWYITSKIKYLYSL